MFIFILACVGLIWYLFMAGISALGLYVAKKRYSIPIAPPTPLPDAAPVSILRPLRGLDCNLFENLESSFRQKYPKFEILLSVAAEDDAAIPIVQELFEKYPNVDAKLIIGEEIVGVNPKINNLVRTYREAKYDILWIVDSNVLSSYTALAASVPFLTTTPLPGKRPIGLVHHLPYAIYPDDKLGSRVEQAFLCATHAKMYLAINFVAVASCVMGKSCLFKKSVLDKAAAKKKEGGKGLLLSGDVSGIAAFGKYLGEDNMIGEAIWDELGMRHAMGGELAGNAVGTMDFGTFCRRRVRWIRVRKYMVTASTIIEPFTECFVDGIVGSLVFRYFLSFPALLFLPLHVIAWYFIDIKLYSFLLPSAPNITRNRPPYHDGPGLAFLRAWLIRESMALPIWLFAMLGDTVSWRENAEQYRVRKDGSVASVEHGEKEAMVERIWKVLMKRFGGPRDYVVYRPDEENLYKDYVSRY